MQRERALGFLTSSLRVVLANAGVSPSSLGMEFREYVDGPPLVHPSITMDELDAIAESGSLEPDSASWALAWYDQEFMADSDHPMAATVIFLSAVEDKPALYNLITKGEAPTIDPQVLAEDIVARYQSEAA